MAGLTLAMPPRFVELIDSSGRHVLINVTQITTISEDKDLVCIKTTDGQLYFFSDSLSKIVNDVAMTIDVAVSANRTFRYY